MFNIFISIVINVILLLFDLNTFSWLHISQINTEMFLMFFKFTGFTLQNHKRGRETKRLKTKKKEKKEGKYGNSWELRKKRKSLFKLWINKYLVEYKTTEIEYSNFEVSRQMFESLSSKNKNFFRAATQG